MPAPAAGQIAKPGGAGPSRAPNEVNCSGIVRRLHDGGRNSVFERRPRPLVR
jgi:hypothetical protein